MLFDPGPTGSDEYGRDCKRGISRRWAWIEDDGRYKDGGVKVTMKSMKLIAIILSLMAVSAHATSTQHGLTVHDWPRHWVNEEQDLCVIPIYMDLPGFARVVDMDELEIHLESLDMWTYEGCTDFGIICSIDVRLGCRVKSNGVVGGDYTCKVKNPHVPVTGPDPVTRTACVRLENVGFDKLPAPNDTLEVATLTLTVVPL
jgi:hypothetical protein